MLYIKDGLPSIFLTYLKPKPFIGIWTYLRMKIAKTCVRIIKRLVLNNIEI